MPQGKTPVVLKQDGFFNLTALALIIGIHYSPTLRYGCGIVVVDDGSDEKYQLNLRKSVISTLF